MRNWLATLCAALLLPALLAAAWAVGASQTPAQNSAQPTAQNPAQQPAQLSDLVRESQSFTAVCAHCHNLQMVMSTPKSYGAWHDTVQKMINHGAKATDDQLDDIMDYLHRTMTAIDVNSADADELEIILNVPDATAQAIVERRKTKKFTSLSDLKSISGVDAAIVDAKARMIFFQ